jgi:hypothetical protein
LEIPQALRDALRGGARRAFALALEYEDVLAVLAKAPGVEPEPDDRLSE